jgi:integrase
MPDGSVRRVQKFETLGPISKKEAAQALRDRLAASQTLKREPVTFSELAAVWKATVLPMYKHSTRRHHVQILEKKLLPIFGDSRLDRISRQDIQRFVADMNQRGYSPNSIDHYHNVLSTVLTKAVQWEYITNNPASGVELPKLVTVLPKWALTPEQAQQLLSVLAPLPRALVSLAIMTGVRRGELFALRWNSFDEIRATLTIQEAVYEGVIDRPKTALSLRVIPLSPALVHLLREWKKSAKRKAPDDFVFGSRDGKPKEHKQVMRDHIKPACKVLELPNVTWLTFRRTFATWADQNGVSAKQRGELMGNSAEVNAMVYTQVLDQGLRLAVERVSKELVTDCSLSSEMVN